MTELETSTREAPEIVERDRQPLDEGLVTLLAVRMIFRAIL